ncbi:MAG: hypothetical protein P4L53_16275 [Candidatus Obscuribacterales bacterium]|nr:hypothetical protein [Candidatus Obscuribacterales bacterium]
MKYLSALPLRIALVIVSMSVTSGAANSGTESGKPPITTTAYKTYANARFGYQINYPAEVLTAQGEPDNSDGQKFVAKKGDAQMSVWGNYKVDGGLDDELKMAKESNSKDAPQKKVSYYAGGKNWFAISGTSGDRIFYQKTCLRNDTFRTLTFSYPQSSKAQFAPIVDKVVASFKWCPK